MMERTKRIRWNWILRMGFCLALVAAMVLIGAVMASAEDMKYSQGLVFTSYGDGTCYISGRGTCTDADLIIPAFSPDGDRVTRIKNETFANCSWLILAAPRIPLIYSSNANTTYHLLVITLYPMIGK